MEKAILGAPFVCQIAMIVRDAQKAASRFAELLNVPVPQVVTANADGSDTVTYMGRPTEGRVKLAFFHLDNVVVEFIEPTEDPTTWKDFLAEKGPGVHHIAFKAKNRMLETAAELERFGYPLIQHGDKYAYLESTEELGVILELLDID
ncbi:VOC family protein [Paenibacillus sp. MWE-103]|uniref:VOC family protein n=1 Tax=Paenibacillus artemisiicola TaxID=1172618 RepID=A0ABS3WGP5_9BACL|nr:MULTISPECIES: VOC family protein [Paenibacillus]MBO7747483.1 VOC family protein [Paenibacillus artemisiicola]SFJ85568.1 Glyoxalase/Bleomycin resistance protein/Dioxygenase superfamily protein [Paenibacillus sp. UNC496MF]